MRRPSSSQEDICRTIHVSAAFFERVGSAFYFSPAICVVVTITMKLLARATPSVYSSDLVLLLLVLVLLFSISLSYAPLRAYESDGVSSDLMEDPRKSRLIRSTSLSPTPLCIFFLTFCLLFLHKHMHASSRCGGDIAVALVRLAVKPPLLQLLLLLLPIRQHIRIQTQTLHHTTET